MRDAIGSFAIYAPIRRPREYECVVIESTVVVGFSGTRI